MKHKGDPIDGILVVSKPVGISSFGALSIVKRRLNIAKMGHLGTLDPLACGVLVLLCGKATKLTEKLSGKTKVYRSIFRFGIETDTLDLAGETTATSEKVITREMILEVLPEFIGEVEITIPRFSAVHINGARAYDLARNGTEFTAPKKIVKISRFELLAELGSNEFYFEIECETGTYIRSLAQKLANRLGSVAIASLIQRTRVGDFKIENAKDIKKISIADLMQIEI
ncbi:MAG: tRNA pseudouridine(55) synthase TruB [Christensenellaceae bacterium]|jgi:tRNA pseudouridine55 synthase|nr:tRNA pseudouridine(55) synthase TruB [Christensenellaceae bacterium]